MDPGSFSWCDPLAEVPSDCPLASAFMKQPSPPINVVFAGSLESGSQKRRRRRLRRHASSWPCANLRAILLASICSLLWCRPCAATTAAFGIEEDMAAVVDYGEILFDRSPPPAPHVRLIKRATDDDNPTSSRTSSTGAGAKASTSTAPASSSSTSQNSALPRPFDSSLGNNFTASSCPDFFESFLSNSTFNACNPLSLLLQVSLKFE